MRALLILLLTLILLFASAPAASSRALRQFGPQVGFSDSPDQVVAGLHLTFVAIAPAVDFEPSVDIGAGDDQTVVSVNGDFHFRIPVSGSSWQPYVGAGLALHEITSHWGAFDHHSSATGGQFMLGARVPTAGRSTFGVEGRFAFGDGPGLKALASWSFPLR